MDNKDFDFVAKHYKRGAFSAKFAWHRLGIASPMRWYRRAAAAAAVAAVLGATATVFYLQHKRAAETEVTPLQPEVQQAQPAAKAPRYMVRAIDFDNAPLTAVVSEIETVYKVKVSGVPDDADSLKLTLHYDGDADGLIAVINEILETNMTITTAE